MTCVSDSGGWRCRLTRHDAAQPITVDRVVRTTSQQIGVREVPEVREVRGAEVRERCRGA